MVSPSSAAAILPSHSALVPQALISATRQGMQRAAVSKQDTQSVPKLHGGSFQTFGDALDSALWQPDVSGLEGRIAQAIQFGASASGNPPGAQSQFPATEINGSEGPEQGSSLAGAPTDAQHAGTVMPRERDANVQSDQNEAADKIASSETRKTQDLKPSLTAQLAVPVRSALEPISQVPTDTVGNGVIGPYEGGKAPEIVSAVPVSQSQMGRLTGASAAQTAPQGRANAQPNPIGFNTDAEAFQINLYADDEPLQATEPGSVPARGVQRATEPVSPGGSSDQKQIQNSPADMASGKIVTGKTPVNNEAPATPADGATKAVAATQGPQTGRRPVVPSGSEEDKRSDKGAMDNGPEAGMLKDAMTPPATSIRPPERIANEGSAPLGSTRPGEMVEVAQSSAGSPAKEMVVRIQGDGGEVVNVRVLDQGGQVQVAVRSSDPVTAAQLRQDLSSLTSNLDRIGWKADTAAAPTAQAPGLHDASRPDSESQSGQKGSTPGWDEGPARKKYSTSELWDEVLAGQHR